MGHRGRGRAWALMLCLSAMAMTDMAEARRESLSPEQRGAFAKIDRILIESLALTDQGQVDAKPIEAIVGRRLKELGFTPVTDATQAHDAHLRVKCEQRKVWEGTIRSGGDADLPDSPSRTWKGPACQFRYLVNNKPMSWAKEVRTEFADAITAAAEAHADSPGAFALNALQERLEQYDFPLLLAAEWGQESRLLAAIDRPGASPTRKAGAIHALGEMFSEPAVPRLQQALKDPDIEVAKAAAIALGNIGHQSSVSSLIELMNTGQPDLRLAAARGLGTVGALHGDPTIIPPLLEALKTDDLRLKTEVVWALGQLPDRRSYEPLVELQQSLGHLRTSDRASLEGKLWDAVHYSIKQLDGFDQIN